jgi:hypothetical protein
VARRREPVMSDHDVEEVERGWAVMWRPGELSRLVPPVHWERDESADTCEGWTWPVSGEALRIWARRVGVDPDAAVAWSHERFSGGQRRYGPPPRPVYADTEACARGRSSPSERRTLEN